MLGKLIKYDLKALNRFMFIIHAFLLAAAILGRIFLTGRLDFRSQELNLTLLLTSYMLYLLVIVAASLGTYMVIAVRFYKSIFSDEGYLTNTLPVTRSSILLSKMISGGLWTVLDVCLIALSTYILLSTTFLKEMLITHQTDIIQELNFSNITELTHCIYIIVFIFIISALSALPIIYASIILGQLFENHKILGSVVVYFALTTLISLLSTILMGVTGLLKDAMTMANTSINFREYLMQLFTICTILTVSFAVVSYIVSHIVFNKKLNLS